MLKKLEKKRRVLELGFALGFALTILLTAFAAHRRQVADRVCADTVRLHILANSDTLEDQLVKLQVRDAILAALPDSVLQADTTTGAEAALRQMLRQTGAPVYDADGYLQKGVIVRHLALPGHTDDSFAVLALLARIRDEEGVPFIPSLMSQFTPFYKAAEHNLGRRITTYEYRKVIDEAVRLGLTDGYMQEKSSAREEYTPPFDLEGV